MKARRVLFVSQELPWPPVTGGLIRTHRMLAGLAQRFDVTLIASGAERESARAGRAELEGLGCAVELVADVKRPGRLGVARSAASGLLRGKSMVLRHNRNPHLEAAVRARLGACEGVQLNQLDTFECFQRARANGAAVVLDTQNVLHQYYARRGEHESSALARYACRREARLLEAYELAAFREVSRTVVCSQPERASLLALDPSLAVEVVPNGVDPQPPEPEPHPGRSGAGFDMVFVGDMRYGPNADGALYFAGQILPRILTREPKARFVVVGQSPPRKLLLLAEGKPHIRLLGFVPDVREPLRRARVAVVPLRYGSGTRLKVLEAFALGVPVVATHLGAEGLEVQDGKHLLLADEPEEMAIAVARLFDDRAQHRSLAAAARELAQERYAWPALAQRMGDVLEQAMDEAALRTRS